MLYGTKEVDLDILNALRKFAYNCQADTLYTKTGLVFSLSKNQILVAVIPGLKYAEDFPRTEIRRGLSPD